MSTTKPVLSKEEWQRRITMARGSTVVRERLKRAQDTGNWRDPDLYEVWKDMYTDSIRRETGNVRIYPNVEGAMDPDTLPSPTSGRLSDLHV